MRSSIAAMKLEPRSVATPGNAICSAAERFSVCDLTTSSDFAGRRRSCRAREGATGTGRRGAAQH